MAGRNPIIGELPRPFPSIAAIPTDVAAFIDFFGTGPVNTPTTIESLLEFRQTFGDLHDRSEASYQIEQFFQNGGNSAIVLRIAPDPSDPSFATTLQSAIATIALPFNLLCIPATANLASADMRAVMIAAQKFCATHGAFYIADIPPSSVIANPSAMATWFTSSGLDALDCAAIYYPRLTVHDALHQNAPREIGVSGTVAGIYARIDNTRGVWRAPAGGEASIAEATPIFNINDATNEQLTVVGINAIRSFPDRGTLLWGARTTAGASNSDYRYISVRRLSLYIERSLTAGLKWVVFEPNTPTLWASIRLAIESFLFNLWKQNAFQGNKPQLAYFVKCDATTMTQDDIDNGRVNIQVGFAAVKPAEFLLLNISLLAVQAP